MIDTPITLDANTLQELIDRAVAQKVSDIVDQLSQDPQWTQRVERMLNQAVVQRTVAALGSIDIGTMVNQRVDETMEQHRQTLLKNFASTGIEDLATSCQLTVMDDATVIENKLTVKQVEAVDSIVVNHLIVKGSINTDNQSWQALESAIAEKTVESLNESWRDQLVQQVAKQIQTNGIDFDSVSVNGKMLVNGHELAGTVTESNLQSVGQLRDLRVKGEAQINETLTVVRGRMGVNTREPEMALSIWDEEVSVILGKNKAKQAYIGTSRDQSLALGVNRIPQIEIDVDGLTTVKKLRVNLHRIGFDSQPPGWHGTRGDIVFNSNPTSDRVFGWVCLGAYKWQPLKSSE